MAILQISKIQQRSGNLVDLPQLDEAEFGWASDQRRLFIGKTTPNENVEVLTGYSTISFSQIDGAVGNLNITATSLADGEVLAFDGTNWVNRGGNAGGLITLGDAGNVKLGGGASGYVLQTDGTGNLSWTPKATITASIENVTKANPAVVTTTEDNFFTDGSRVTITDAQGMTELNGNSYYADVLTSNTFSLYSDSGLIIPIDSTSYSAYAYTNVSGTTVNINEITVSNSSPFTIGSAVKFVGNMSTSNISNTATYYVQSKPNSTSLKIATSPDGNLEANIVPLQTTTGLTANVYQQGGRAIANVGGSGGILPASGTNTMIQFNSGGTLAGNAALTYDSVATLLTVNGNINVYNLNSSGLVSGTRLVSNVTTGTTPLQVASTTRVANLNVAHSNVSDYGAVTTQTTGTFYPIFVSANTSANYALASNANLSFNAATGLLTTSTLAVTGNANVGNLGTAGLVTATGNVTGGNVVATSYHIRSITTGITAAGSVQGTATVLTKEINVVSTVSSGANGVVLPTAVAGMVLIINNTSANTLSVYPATGGAVNSGSVNDAYPHGSGASIQYYATSGTQWYTVGATFA